MVTLITGAKGSGKTKLLIERVNAAAQASSGNVICIEKKKKLIYDVTSRARLIAADDYFINNYDAFYGFLCGICAQDHDITDIFADATLRIGGRDFQVLARFLKKTATMMNSLNMNITLTISADKKELPAEIFEYCEEITF